MVQFFEKRFQWDACSIQIIKSRTRAIDTSGSLRPGQISSNDLRDQFVRPTSSRPPSLGRPYKTRSIMPNERGAYCALDWFVLSPSVYELSWAAIWLRQLKI